MIKKGDQTRAKILESARVIFSEKGYTAATMKDFCEETGLSRGGLYRHFSSTKEIMIEMLDSDITSSRAELEKDISSEMSAKEILSIFIDYQRESIKNNGGDLELAKYEFCKSEKDQAHYMHNHFTSSVEIFEQVIRYGQKNNEFAGGNAKEMANRIVFLLEGLRISSSIISISEDLLKEQLDGVLKMIISGR